MPAPRRQAEWGTVESIYDDLVLIRDVGGLAFAGVDRLEATLRLLRAGATPSNDELTACRELLRRQIRQCCAAYAATHRGDPAVAAATDSLEEILLHAPDSNRTSAAIRRAALQKHGCVMQADSLRKREQPIMRAIAAAVFDQLQAAVPDEETPFTALDILDLLRPFAELAETAVTNAADLFAKRAALDNVQIVDEAIAYAIYAVAQLGVLPVYALERLEQTGETDIAHNAVGYLLHAMISVPFKREPDDINQLATTTRLGKEDPQEYYERLISTPIMRPVVQRFIEWLASHDPKVCKFAANDVMIGYCGPHYYAAICECWVSTADDWASGDFQQEFRDSFAAIQLAGRLPPTMGSMPRH